MNKQETTDFELLKAAATTAGYRVVSTDRLVNRRLVVLDGATATSWNPLTDDGDALRLAVLLELDLYFSSLAVRAMHRENDRGAAVRRNDDTAAATRLAIVRAAAAIGATMQPTNQ